MTDEAPGGISTSARQEKSRQRVWREYAFGLPGIRLLCSNLIPALVEDHRNHDLHPIRHFTYEGVSIRTSLLHEADGARETYRCHLAVQGRGGEGMEITVQAPWCDQGVSGAGLLTVNPMDMETGDARRFLDDLSDLIGRYAGLYLFSRISGPEELACGEERVMVSKWKPLVIDDECEPAMS